MKILICGDSFASDWQVKYPLQKGWPNLLVEQYDVVNLAQAGCSEYKILLQLKSADLTSFDCVIVSHTSPYRIPVKTHPVHARDPLHNASDLIYTDIKEHSRTNKRLLPLVEYFEQYFDVDYAKFTHSLICREIDVLVQNCTVLHLTNLDWTDLYVFESMLNFEYLFKSHRGLMNHYTDEGNRIVFEKIIASLTQR